MGLRETLEAALDRLEALLHDATTMPEAQIPDVANAIEEEGLERIATVRQELQRLREERDGWKRTATKHQHQKESAMLKRLDAERDRNIFKDRAEHDRLAADAAEAEVRQLREDVRALIAERDNALRLAGSDYEECATERDIARERAESAEAEVRRLKQENDELAEQAYQDRSKAQRLTEGLREYGHHKQGCNQLKSPGLGRSPEFSGQECDCGLAALLSANPPQGDAEGSSPTDGGGA